MPQIITENGLRKNIGGQIIMGNPREFGVIEHTRQDGIHMRFIRYGPEVDPKLYAHDSGDKIPIENGRRVQIAAREKWMLHPYIVRL